MHCFNRWLNCFLMDQWILESGNTTVHNPNFTEVSCQKPEANLRLTFGFWHLMWELKHENLTIVVIQTSATSKWDLLLCYIKSYEHQTTLIIKVQNPEKSPNYATIEKMTSYNQTSRDSANTDISHNQVKDPPKHVAISRYGMISLSLKHKAESHFGCPPTPTLRCEKSLVSLQRPEWKKIFSN